MFHKYNERGGKISAGRLSCVGKRRGLNVGLRSDFSSTVHAGPALTFIFPSYYVTCKMLHAVLIGFSVVSMRNCTKF